MDKIDRCIEKIRCTDYLYPGIKSGIFLNTLYNDRDRNQEYKGVHNQEYQWSLSL